MARRAQVASSIVVAMFVVLGGAFFRIQVLDDDYYAQQARQNRLRPVRVPAPRGVIVDRRGEALATNEPSYTVSILASSEDAMRATLDSMVTYALIEADDIETVVQRFRRSLGNPVVIQRDAPFDAIATLEERRPAFPGLIIQTEPKRRYPQGDLTAHVLGYVGEISEEELNAARRRTGNARLGALVGRGGLEDEYDAALRGYDGERMIVVDALGRMIDATGNSRLEPRQGDTLRTTLDLDLQRFARDEFPVGYRGAVVAMDPRTGGILAMVSVPSFDPNAFVGGVDPELWASLLASEDTPLLNRAVQGIYPPASPWKLAVAAIALERGEVTVDSRMPVRCRGGMQYFNRYFRCWKADGHGDLTLAEAIQHSCDVYFYQLGLQLGLDTLLHESTRLGFASRSGIDLPAEQSPTFPASTQYFDRLYGPGAWTSGVTLNLAIGQGENAQTPINMVKFYGALARGDGRAPTPHLVEALDGPPVGDQIISPEHVRELREALEMVVESGTAIASRVRNLRIAGKTGTAQNAHGENHGWFIAFAPAEAPEIVVGAIVEFGEHGSSVAPYVNRIIARHLLGPAVDLDRPVQYVLPSDSAPGEAVADSLAGEGRARPVGRR